MGNYDPSNQFITYVAQIDNGNELRLIDNNNPRQFIYFPKDTFGEQIGETMFNLFADLLKIDGVKEVLKKNGVRWNFNEHSSQSRNEIIKLYLDEEQLSWYNDPSTNRFMAYCDKNCEIIKPEMRDKLVEISVYSGQVQAFLEGYDLIKDCLIVVVYKDNHDIREFKIPIIVNGEPIEVDYDEMSYEKLIDIVNKFENRNNTTYSVTFSRNNYRNGCMVKGDKVKLTRNMIFNAFVTDNA